MSRLGPWSIREVDAELVVELNPPRVLADAAWDAVLDVQGTSRIESTPTPADDDGRTHVRWSTEHLPTEQAPKATVSLPWLTSLRVGSAQQRVVDIAFLVIRFFLLPVMLVLLAVAVLVPEARSRPRSRLRMAVSWLPATVLRVLRPRTAGLLVLVTLLSVMIAVFLLYRGYRTQPEEAILKNSAILLLFALYYLLAVDKRWDRSIAVAMLVILLAALALPAFWEPGAIFGSARKLDIVPYPVLVERLLLVLLIAADCWSRDVHGHAWRWRCCSPALSSASGVSCTASSCPCPSWPGWWCSRCCSGDDGRRPRRRSRRRTAYPMRNWGRSWQAIRQSCSGGRRRSMSSGEARRRCTRSMRRTSSTT